MAEYATNAYKYSNKKLYYYGKNNHGLSCLIYTSLSYLQCFDGESDHPSSGQNWGLEEDSQPAG